MIRPIDGSFSWSPVLYYQKRCVKGLELRAVEIDEAVPIETLAVFSLFNLRLVNRTNSDFQGCKEREPGGGQRRIRINVRE